MSNFLNYFDDWKTTTITVEEQTTTQNAAGVPETEWSSVAEDIEVQFWTESTQETNVNDKFVDQRTGYFLLNPKSIDFTPDNTMRFKIGSEIYYISGVDNIAHFNDVITVAWRKEY